MLTSSVACDVSSLFATKKCEKIQKIDKIVITCKENLHIFRTICRISMEFSGKVSHMITLKVTQKQGLTFSLENAVLEENTGRQIEP